MAQQFSWLGRAPVAVENPQGRGRIVLVCDHASNWVPPSLARLGLAPAELERHIAWDPGALQVASRMARLLEAPLVYATFSRLVIDVNRDPTHAGSIVPVSEGTPIPGNATLSQAERSRRVSDIYEPYHQCLAQILEAQLARHSGVELVAVHTFTPVYRGQRRPWHVGVVSGSDRRVANPLLEVLRADPGLTVGDNQPYGPADGVYHTLEKHSAPRALRSVMLEVRADLVEDETAKERWARLLSEALDSIH